MVENMIGNFAFMFHINRELYDKLCSAEKQARTNFRNSGHESREALEIFIRLVLNRYNNLSRACRGQELRAKIDNLRDESFLKAEGYLSADETLAEKPILPDLGEVTFKYDNGREETADYWDFIRKYGNTCSHADTRPSDVKLSYENTIKCLKGLFLLMKRFYRNQISNSVGAFNENLMPIEEYCVYDSYIPADSVRSKCIREFLAFIKDDNGEKSFYAILRLYNKADSNEVFMLRNQKCFTEAAKLSLSSVPDGMTRMRELIPKDSQASSFYIISYIFNQEPHPLTETLIKGMSLGQRVKLCARIVNCLDNLHTSPIPIFHRMLNYESIFTCEIRNEWIPYIIKFDYAKILSQAPVGTVFANAVKAKEKINEEKLNKYLPPEWDSLSQDATDKEWAKVDIYSLGILFADILAGKIGVNPVPIDELEELDLSEEMLDLLDIMRADDPNERWDIEDVKDIFDEEQRRFRKK